ncbi:hypothetical protein E4P82_07460 [Candidatus Competibacter phosphatis]|uniref:Uncharacterized protein n=1 Tax=Candidatus Competibacter phosphatis TaxID=221280 RepID=A0ABX1TM76_9GAMM|nr:hypothetical protein [Candidatus Competibacter phosphatis]NMQ19056.1 hypothetical protein [Candidatus Competibacter phosphatis]
MLRQQFYLMQLCAYFLNNRENLDGIREVLRSLNRWQAQREEKPIPVLATLSRVPEQDKQDDEETVIKEIKEFLSSEANDLNDTLSIENVFVLHSEPALQLRESLRVGRGVTIDESILLRDYLRLFSYFVPAEMIRPKIAGLFQAARDKIWTDPETATKEVEQLAEFYGRPEGFRELLQFYIIRNMLDENALKVAQRYWELTNDAKEPSLKPIVRKVFFSAIFLEIWEKMEAKS